MIRNWKGHTQCGGFISLLSSLRKEYRLTKDEKVVNFQWGILTWHSSLHCMTCWQDNKRCAPTLWRSTDLTKASFTFDVSSGFKAHAENLLLSGLPPYKKYSPVCTNLPKTHERWIALYAKLFTETHANRTVGLNLESMDKKLIYALEWNAAFSGPIFTEVTITY
jgi:hypothetical protein